MAVETKSTQTVFDLYFDLYKGREDSLPSVIPSSLEEGLDYYQVCTAFFNFFFTEQNLNEFFQCFEVYKDRVSFEYDISSWDLKEETSRIINNALKDIFAVIDKELSNAKSEAKRVDVLNEFQNHLENFFKQQNLSGENQRRFLRLQPEFLKRIKSAIRKNLLKRRKQFELQTSEVHFHLQNLIRPDNRSFHVIHDLLFEHFLQSRPGDSKKELFAFFQNTNSLVRPYNWVGSTSSFIYLFRKLNEKKIIRYRKSFWPELKKKFVLNGQVMPDTINSFKINFSKDAEPENLHTILLHFSRLTK